jgi:hypothetical protein
MSEHYPRGQNALVPLLHRFSPNETENWFRERGVILKIEADGRMFPISDSSQTIIDCLMGEASRLGIMLRSRTAVESIRATPDHGFELALGSGTVSCGQVLIACGGCRSPGSVALLRSLGHRVSAPVPSLFSFHIPAAWLAELAGISLSAIEVTVVGTKLREKGPAVITHTGLSGPVILRASAWGARELHQLDYHFDINVKWIPDLSEEELREHFRSMRESNPNRHVANSPVGSLPARLWSSLVRMSGIDADVRWAILTRAQTHSLLQNLLRCRLSVSGKSLNKEEFVTCGGVKLREVDLKTMQSRITPGLFFAGEVLDIDGITGGFNFQAAWTTGWVAGKAMAANR